MRKMLLMTGCLLLVATHAQSALAQEQTVSMHVSGMTCGTCPITVRHRVLQMRGVHSARVDLDTALATVTFEDSEQSPQTIAQAITKLGYPAIITGKRQ